MSSIPSIYDGRDAWKGYMLEQAHVLMDGCDLGTEVGRDELLHRAVRWDVLESPAKDDLWVRRYFWPEICRLANEREEYIFDHLSAWRESDKKQKHDEVIRAALGNAASLDSMDIARESLLDAFSMADTILAERPLGPVRSLSDDMADMWSRLQRMQGVRYPGFVQKTLPDFDDATGGLQGLMLLGAASGGGKTTLALQMGLDALEHDEDLCLLIVSADMLKWRIEDRLLTNRSELPIRIVQSGSTDKGWTATERTAVESGWSELGRLAKRIRILDRHSFPHASRHNIQREEAKLMDASRCNHCMTIIDFMQLMPVPSKLKALEIDDYLIEEVRALADAAGNDPRLVLVEATKSLQGEKGSNQNIKGSNRILMRADCIITLSEWDANDLVGHYDINNGYLVRRATPAEFKKESEKLKMARDIRKELEKKGEAPTLLKIGKGRDGAVRSEFNVVHYFNKSRFTPWFDS